MMPALGAVTDPGPHVFWITSRAAGTAALVLASMSVTVGLMIGGKLMSGQGRGGDLRAVHEALALAALAAIALHGLSLLGDPYLHPGIGGIAVPFAGRYRPLWTGLGIIGGWGLAVLGLTYYARERIGQARWRALHRFTVAFWGLGVVHTIGSGTDAKTLWYLALVFVVVVPPLIMFPARLAAADGRRPPPRSRRPTRSLTGAPARRG
jgi:methionine sulfoxide reductase heme-binding subunit